MANSTALKRALRKRLPKAMEAEKSSDQKLSSLPRDTAMPSLEAGLLVAVPLRDKRLEATQVTLVQLAARNMSPSGRLVADLLVGRMKAVKD